MLDNAQGISISGNPAITHVGGNAVFQSGVTNVIPTQNAVSSRTLWAKIMHWTPENQYKLTKGRLNETLDILEAYKTVIPRQTLKRCQEEEQELRNECRQVEPLVGKKGAGSYLVDKRYRKRLHLLHSKVDNLYKLALDGSHDGRNRELRSYLEQLKNVEMDLGADSNDEPPMSDDQSSCDLPQPVEQSSSGSPPPNEQSSASSPPPNEQSSAGSPPPNEQSSSGSPPPDDPDEGYDSDSSFATCRTSRHRSVV